MLIMLYMPAHHVKGRLQDAQILVGRLALDTVLPVLASLSATTRTAAVLRRRRAPLVLTTSQLLLRAQVGASVADKHSLLLGARTNGRSGGAAVELPGEVQ